MDINLYHWKVYREVMTPLVLLKRWREAQDVRQKANKHRFKQAWMVFLGLILALSTIFLMGCNDVAFGYTTEQSIKAVIGEAEGEPQEGKLAVACAIRNRGNLKGVYGLHAPRVKHHLYSEDTYLFSADAWLSSADKDLCENIHGAQYWEGTKFPTPYWAKTMTLTATIGHQRFYRKD